MLVIHKEAPLYFLPTFTYIVEEQMNKTIIFLSLTKDKMALFQKK